MSAPICLADTKVAVLDGWLALRRADDAQPLYGVPLAWGWQPDTVELYPDIHQRLYAAYAATVDADLADRLARGEEIDE